MQRIGIIVNTVGQNESFLYVLNGIDECLSKGDVSVAVFTENPAMPLSTIPCAVLPLSEAWCYNGVLVATTIGNASKLLEILGITDRYFFVNELEWINSNNLYQAEMISAIYADRRLKLIVTSELYRDILRNDFNRDDILVLNKFHFLPDL